MAVELDDPGSSKAELKKLLRLSRDKPVQMAFALGQDGKAILKLDKIKAPSSLERALKSDAKGSRNHRFGTATVDPEQPKAVTFVLNKEVSGFARKLVLALKGTGFKTVRLVTEDGAPLEEAEGDEDEDDAELPPDDEMPVSPSTEPVPGPAVAEQPDAGKLTRTLAGLVKRMIAAIAADPSQKAALAQLAIDAQASLKRGELDQAAAGIEVLRVAVDASAAGVEDPAKANQAVVQKLRKSRVAWTATRAKVDAELDKLSKAILRASDGEDLGDDVESQFYSAVEPVLANLDETLSDVLERAADAEGDMRQQLLAEARYRIDQHLSFVDGNPIIDRLDNNPFQPLSVGKTLTDTLGTLARMMA